MRSVDGSVEQLAHEVDHMAVRVARAEHRDEPEHARGDVPGFGVRGDAALGGGLRRAVERRLHRERRVLGRGHDVGLAVDRTGRGEQHAPHTGGAHRLEHVLGGDDVLLEVAPRGVPAEAHVGVGREVDHRVEPGDQVGKLCRVAEEVALHELEAVVRGRTVEMGGVAGR